VRDQLIQWWQKLSPRTRLFVGIATTVVILDQWTKYLAVAGLTKAFLPVAGGELSFFERLGRFLTLSGPPRDSAYAVLENFWHFKYVENPGAAWGFLQSAPSWFRTPFFLAVSVAAMVFIVVYFRKTQADQKLLRVALALVFGGAVGNFIDRARLGYVIDFIDWHWYERSWPTFNIADSAITVGVVLLVLDMKLYKPNKLYKPKQQETSTT